MLSSQITAELNLVAHPPLFTQFTIGIKKKLPCYFNAGENSPVAVSPDPVSTDVLVAAADL